MSETIPPITALSKQADILFALTAQLEGITPANGYAYDLTGVVFRGRTLFGDDTPVPALVILEAPRPGVVANASEDKVVRKTSWELLIQGWVSDDKKNPLDPVYPLKASVEHRLARVLAMSSISGKPMYPAEYLLGRVASTGAYRIADMKLGPGVARPPDKQVSSRAFFYLPLTIDFKEDLSAPFV